MSIGYIQNGQIIIDLAKPVREDEGWYAVRHHQQEPTQLFCHIGPYSTEDKCLELARRINLRIASFLNGEITYEALAQPLPLEDGIRMITSTTERLGTLRRSE